MSIELKITGGHVVLIDEEDLGLINSYNKWKLSKRGYPQSRKMINYKTKYTYMHRLIMNCPEGSQVDHINGNKLDNRKCNLRICAHKDNCKNRPKPINNTSGHKGVSFSKCRNKWIAVIVSNKKRYYLGSFVNKEDAILAYRSACLEMHGEYANLT